MADPATRIVSLTITEGGYLVNQATGEFDADDPSIQARPRPTARCRRPSSASSSRRCARRRAAGTEPFTVMSCDNIQGNGEVAHKMIGAFARLKDAELAAWIEEHVTFPNSHGRPDHAGHHRRTTGPTLAERVRRRGRLAGGLRAVHPVGARGPVPDRAAAVRRGRRRSWCRTSSPTS